MATAAMAARDRPAAHHPTAVALLHRGVRSQVIAGVARSDPNLPSFSKLARVQAWLNEQTTETGHAVKS